MAEGISLLKTDIKKRLEITQGAFFISIMFILSICLSYPFAITASVITSGTYPLVTSI
jgi:hypothetical protein